EDFVYAEVLDAKTGNDVADGEPGVLVLTHLDKEAGPLVRWWTGDVVVRDQSPCSCGRTHARLLGGVKGRADDMLIVRGVNVFPSAVEEIVRGTDGFLNEYRLIVDDSVRDPDSGLLKGIRIQAEVEDGADQDALSAVLAAAIKEKLNIRATVQAMPQGSLPRTEHKASRLVVQP
ncbi:MAG TPA: CoA ligase, partial [Rhodospirillaceae bacterium]|nr:CoA ligase [Rhodospirillaceae bacterium]